jgi:fluoroquinolone resistance protein
MEAFQVPHRKLRKGPSGDSLLEAAGCEQPVTGAVFAEEDIVGADISALRFENCEFHDCRFEDAIIRDSTFTGCRFAKCRFRQTRFRNTSFTAGREESACTWAFCDLSESSFEECNLSLNRIDKSEAYLTSFADCSAMGLLFNADVHKWVSKRIVIGGVKFERCRMQYAAFEELDLSKSTFVACDLRDVSFRRANLTDCTLTGSSLSNADFTGATLDGAALARANFDAFDLTAPISYAGLLISRDQAETILRGLGIVMID